MSELAQPLRHVLGETGYLRSNGSPAATTVTICNPDEPRRGTLKPDVRWRNDNLNVYFKFHESPNPEVVGTWQQEVWNEGSVPLLWVVEPGHTTLYNGFATPKGTTVPGRAKLATFTHNATPLAGPQRALGMSDLNTRAGRLAMETGSFWSEQPSVNRKGAVDVRLLDDIGSLELRLRRSGLSADRAQGLIGRTIFAQYLVDRGIVTREHLDHEYGVESLHEIFRSPEHAGHLFGWLAEKFNGDMFPSGEATLGPGSLQEVGRFLKGEASGQGSLFPYRFELIPIELISSIYEQFVHSADADIAKELDVHYTPLAAVSLIMDEVMQNITGGETVLDLTCGSGVFLVDALRRLVEAKHARCGERTRHTVRQTLYNQVFGVDKSAAAIRVAAFSLYLAALELDPDPSDQAELEFKHLVGRTLFEGDAHEKDFPRKFHIVVGNPPWSYKGRAGTAARRAQRPTGPRSPRGVSLDFVKRAKDLAHHDARFGLILSATPFFAESRTGRQAAQDLVEPLSPLTLIDLSSHQWLFKKATMPAMGLVAGYRPMQDKSEMALVRVPWSKAGQHGHALGIGASDIQTLPIASWRRNPALFKSAFVGRLHDHLLLEKLFERQKPLRERLAAIGTDLHMGWTRGNRSRPSDSLSGLPFLERNLRRFSVQEGLPAFGEQEAERPRERSIYRAPLLIVQENLRRSPRPVVAVASQDVVYTKSYFGASIPPSRGPVAELLAGILSSAFAAWYLYMAGPDFGLWKRRVRVGTTQTIPVPDLAQAANGDGGRRVVDVVGDLQGTCGDGELPAEAYGDLDKAVADLYGFDGGDCTVILDGLRRAEWQWQSGRLKSSEPVNMDQLKQYASAFVAKFDPWFRAANERRLRADVYEALPTDPLRMIRFVLENHPSPSTVRSVASSDTGRALDEACRRLGEPGAFTEMARNSEVRLASNTEIVVAKPAAHRHWLAVNAFADARAVLEESFRSGERA